MYIFETMNISLPCAQRTHRNQTLGPICRGPISWDPICQKKPNWAPNKIQLQKKKIPSKLEVAPHALKMLTG